MPKAVSGRVVEDPNGPYGIAGEGEIELTPSLRPIQLRCIAFTRSGHSSVC